MDIYILNNQCYKIMDIYYYVEITILININNKNNDYHYNKI